MKIKEQTRKLAAGCSKHCFEVVDRTDVVSSKHCFEVVDRTDEVSNIHTYGKATLTRFEEIFEEYNIAKRLKKRYNVTKSREVWDEARKQVRTSRTLSKK